jgi:two-component system, sensor histidine kinase PdtaS
MKKICTITFKIAIAIFLVFSHFAGRSQIIESILPIQQTDISTLEKIVSNPGSILEKADALNLLAVYYLEKPYPRSSNLNKALQIARKSTELSERTGLTKSYNDAQFLIACVYLRKQQRDSALTLLNNVNDSTKFKILFETAHACRINDKLDQATKILFQAKESARQLNDSLKNIMVLKEFACLQSINHQPDAEKALLNVVNLQKRIRYPYVHLTYLELFQDAFLKGNDDKALFYTEQSLKCMGKIKDSSGAADILYCYGVIMAKTGDHEKSVQYLEQAIELYKHQYGDAGISTVIGSLVENLIKLKQPTEADNIVTLLFRDYPPDNTTDSLKWLRQMGSFYRLTKNYGRAETCFKKAMQISQEHNLKLPYYELGQLYVESGNFKKAKFYLEKALQNLDNITTMRTRAHLHYCLFLADSATGNYLSAIRHLSLNKRYDDTVLKQSKIEAVEKYKTQFETEKKDAKIVLLIKEQELGEANLKRIRLIKNVTLLGSLVLLVVVSVIYLLYRKNKKNSVTITRINSQLQRSLTEKEWLLKEVHHRVKNNLHTIICLLESQAMFLEKDALLAIEKSQHRIYAMSLIHQKLYQDEGRSTIDMSLYLKEFIGYLKDSFETRHIDFSVQVAHIHLNLQQAIPVALIINEGVTNSIKYAFDNVKAPRICISMVLEDESVKLVIADNGIGFTPREEDEGKSLGLQLIKGLSKELKGTILLQTEKGTRLTVEFKQEPMSEISQIIQTEEAAI